MRRLCRSGALPYLRHVQSSRRVGHVSPAPTTTTATTTGIRSELGLPAGDSARRVTYTRALSTKASSSNKASPAINSHNNANVSSGATVRSESQPRLGESVGGGRDWHSEVPHWCALCCEPVNAWNDHRGKREHICLEMFYNALVHCERRWDPKAVWLDVDADMGSGFCLSGGRRTSTRPPHHHRHRYPQEHQCRGSHPSPHKENTRADRAGVRAKAAEGREGAWQPPMINAVGELMDTSPTSRHYSRGGGYYANPLSAFQHAFDAAEPQQRRAELVALLRYLMDHKVLLLTPRNLHHSSFEGSLVLFKELFQPLSCLFPYADAKEISAMTQMISATFNSETVFDLCRLECLVPEEIRRSREVMDSGSNTVAGTSAEEDMTTDGEVGLASPTTAPATEEEDGEGQSSCATRHGAASLPVESRAPVEDEGGTSNDDMPNGSSSGSLIVVPNGGASPSLPFFFKGVFCRAILGALRWSLEPDAVPPPPALQRRIHRHRKHCGAATSSRTAEANVDYYAVLAAHACRLLIAELMHCKVCEYVVRVEGIFREEARGLAEAAAFRFGGCSVYNPLIPIATGDDDDRREDGDGTVPFTPSSAGAPSSRPPTARHAVYVGQAAQSRRPAKVTMRGARSGDDSTRSNKSTPADHLQQQASDKRPRQAQWYRLSPTTAAAVKSDHNPSVFGARGRVYLRARPEVVPPAFHWGMLQYCEDGRFFDNNFQPYRPLGTADPTRGGNGNQ